MDAYVNYFHERALDCCDPVAEDVLVDICLHDMREENHVHLKYCSSTTFSQLMEDAEQINESTKRIAKSNATIKMITRKRPLVATMENSKGAKGSK